MRKYYLTIICLLISTAAFSDMRTKTPPASNAQAQNQDQANEQNIDFSYPRQVASAIAPSIFASHPCAIGGAAALGVKNLNIGGGRAKIDPQCEIRETVRLLIGAGETDLAITLLCTTEAAAGLGAACAPTGGEAMKAMQATVDDLTEQNAQLLSVREVDQAELETMRDSLADQIERCDATTSRIEEQCTK